MPGGDSVWWETCVDSIDLHEGCNVRAIANVTYKNGSDTSRNFYAEEKGIVHFMRGKIALLFSVAGSLLNGSEATWKFTSELRPTDVLSISTTTPAHQVKRSITHLGKPLNNSGSLKKVKFSRQGTGRLSSHDQTEVVSKERSLDIKNQVSDLTILHSKLQGEVQALQGKFQSLQASIFHHNNPLRTLEKRLYIKHELRRLMKRTHSDMKGENQHTFSSLFRRCPLEFSIHCTLHDFSTICQELQIKYGSGVRFFPPLTCIQSNIHPLSQKHAVFDSYYSILDWIGISSNEELQTFVRHEVSRKGIHLLQVMGGAHWNMESNMQPLNIFVGKSCSRFLCSIKQEKTLDPIDSNTMNGIEAAPNRNISTRENKTSCISVPTTEWDHETGSFRNKFNVSQRPSNHHIINNNNILDFDAFTFTWRPLPGLRSQDISNIDSERIFIGKLVVYIPAVVFSGSETCQTIKQLLNLIESCDDVYSE
ncbi:MAG: hypothetical protein AAGG81_04405 [Chlamydiota bacterium]